MAKITLVRVDHRLIHGQVITKWVKIAQAQKIIIVDDFLGQDEFMADIYRMAAPSGVEVAILTAEDAGQAFQNNTLGDKNIFILFKNVDMANKAYKAGLKYEKIQLGGIPNEAGKKMVFTAVSLGNQDVEQLNELNKDGVEIVLQVIPEESSMTYENALKSLNKNYKLGGIINGICFNVGNCNRIMVLVCSRSCRVYPFLNTKVPFIYRFWPWITLG